VGRDVVDRLEYPPLRFTPLRPERFTLSNGVPVFFLRDASLPLVSVFVDMKGGHVYLPRQDFGAASALLPLMRNGGTASRSPDSVDEIVESNALGLSTSDDGERMVVGVNSLRRQMGLALDLWADLLLHPRFDSAAVERWRLEELNAIGRDRDFPGTLAVLEFNHLLYGDHPLGWIMSEADLAPDLVTPARLAEIHGRVVCPRTAVIGATGDVTREELQEALERVLKEWRPCARGLDAPPPLELHADPVTYVIPSSLSQSTIVVGQPGGVLLQDDADYFASRVANWLIGESGLTSRLATRLRTDSGLAYSAASIWGASPDHARIFGAITHTRSDRTLDALRMMTETIDSVRVDPPDEAEIELARRDLVNGFVFGFDDPLQVVARQVRFLALGLPPDWPDRYVRGVRAVDRRDVGRVLRKYLDPERFTTLILGDTAHFDLDRVRPYRIVEAPGINNR
jgi:predicted Zn-dependent peptidase